MEGFSVNVSDWGESKWAFIGRDLEIEAKGEWSEENQDGVSEDDYIPMMLYAYPLRERPDDKTIRKIHDKTNLTVVEDTEEEAFYLALCGGGMDLSQDIALSYIIAEDHIPPELAPEVSRQEGLTQYGNNWLMIMRYCRKSLLNYAYGYRESAKSIRKAMREYKEKKVKG